ncbi:hypothetical protein LCGC14_0514830 [marine sediment metagenome]|uniref:Fibronectin type-III domain-containing protein n=1 Tax=marine sediment metagenome TaxID=412755 RepID=A0A0F9SIH7_9ZZZZ
MSRKKETKHSDVMIFTLAVILVIMAIAGYAMGAEVTLAWDPPTENTDTSELTDLAGYNIYYGTSPNDYSKIVNAGNVTTFTVKDLPEGFTYYFYVTAYNTGGLESLYSQDDVSFNIPVLPTTIPKPPPAVIGECRVVLVKNWKGLGRCK